MYRVAKISILNKFDSKCCRIDSLNKYYLITFRDIEGSSEIVVNFSDAGKFNRDSFLEFLRDKFGIKEITGVGQEYLYVLESYELQLLDYIDWRKYVRQYPFDIYNSLIELDDSNHLLFLLNNSCIILTELLIRFRNCYKIENNVLTIFTSHGKFPTYVISDVDKFNILLTKLIVLKGEKTNV